MQKAPRVVYQQGDHVCTLFSSPEEQLTAAIEYISQGLERGERCLYVCGEQTPSAFRAALTSAGIDIDREEARGAIVLLTKETGHLEGGSFSASRMIGMLSGAVEQALHDGFSGLCAAGDMTWLLDDAPGSEEIAQYEALLNHFYRNHRALGLCQYNRRRLPAAILDHGIATHPTVRIAGPILLTNPFYELPETAMHRVASAEGLDARLDRLQQGGPTHHAGNRDHAVAFFHGANFILNEVTTFVADGLAGGEHVIVLATRAHWNLIAARLESAGVNYGRASHEQRLVLIEADHILDDVIVDGRMCVDRLREMLEPLITPDRQVRIYGELVSLLAQRGDVDGAVVLERLGCELVRTHNVQVLCGYRIDPRHPLAARDVARITEAHERVYAAGASSRN